MMYNGKPIDFPAITKISFFKVIEILKQTAAGTDPDQARFSRSLLSEVKKHPILEEGFEDQSLVEKYREPIEKLSKVLFPEALLTNEIKGLTGPFSFTPFYTSTRFKNILEAASGNFNFEPRGSDPDLLYLFGCTTILNAYYQFPVDMNLPFVAEIGNKGSDLVRTYRIAFNADLIEFWPTEKAVDIQYDDYLQLIDNFDDLELWKKKFPPHSWVMRGVGIANLMDITMDQSISNVTSNLLIKTPDSFEKIQANLRNLFNNQELRVGFVIFEHEAFQRSSKDQMKSVILHNKETLNCQEGLCDMTYGQLISNGQPLVISDIDQIENPPKGHIFDITKKQGLKSYLIAPLVYEGEVLGFLELASETKYDLSRVTLTKLSEIIPILSMAASRFKAESQNQMEAIIQEECTSIHPSVKWRFEEEACNYLGMQLNGEQPFFNNIVFKDVCPLYGQLDIKGSSSMRNQAVTEDLITQMKGVKKVLNRAFKKQKLPVFEVLIYQVESYLKEISSGLLAGSEHKILGFLRSEIYPVFDHIKKADQQLAGLVDNYTAMLDKNLNLVYDARNKFDTSVMRTNYVLADFLDRKQEEAQQMFPHYFERYKTDGLEFNLYIGQSMSRNKEFNPIYLRNLRLWQLMVMCQMENEFDRLKPQLEAPLEIASLILVYSSSLAIHFRMDEKRFDVEGAYNARYEIVKKRVDKAHIRGTKERITQPGKIAIIYSSEQDAFEYRKYIEFLQSKGLIEDTPVEDHELENLQGISGLRALRVAISYDRNTKSKRKKKELTVDELVNEIEQGGL